MQGGLGKALERTLNRTGPGMLTDTVREMRAVYQAGMKHLRRNLKVSKASAKAGHVGVFEREVKGGKRVGRLKIVELRGPSVKGMLRHEVMQRGTVLDRAKERADTRLQQEAKQVLRQAGFRD